jgi:hypothetical protein
MYKQAVTGALIPISQERLGRRRRRQRQFTNFDELRNAAPGLMISSFKKCQFGQE